MGCQVFTEMAVAKITIRNPVRCSGSKCRSDKSCKFSRFRACTQYFITTFGETMRFFRKILYLKLHPYTTFFDTPQLRISCVQARNQLGKPEGAKSFLRGPIFLNYVQYFLTLSNTFCRGSEKFSRVALSPLVTGLLELLGKFVFWAKIGLQKHMPGSGFKMRPVYNSGWDYIVANHAWTL